MGLELVLGADTGGTAVKYAICGPDGAVVASGETATNPQDPRDTLSRLAAAARAALPEGGRFAAIGVACAGIVGPRDGHLGRSPNLPGWQNRNLADDVRAAFGDLPARFVNDVNAAVYGEWRLGAGRGRRHLVMIALGTGVGGGVICDGRLLTGARDAAGEIGHMVLDPDGPLCNCGNRGCLEAYAGATGLWRRAAELAAAPGAAAGPAFRALIGDGAGRADLADLHALAEAGDATAAELFAWAGRALGQAVANCVNVLDPDAVIIGGGVARAGRFLLDPCAATARRLIMAEASRAVPLLPAALGLLAAARGAAALAADRGGDGP
ncbi:MAG: ROK family protein [Candidatus Krumholzibacteriia bacterium]